MPKQGTNVTANELLGLVDSLRALLELQPSDVIRNAAVQRVQKLIANDPDGLINLKEISDLVFSCLKFYTYTYNLQFSEFIAQLNMPTDANKELFEILLDAHFANIGSNNYGEELITMLTSLQDPELEKVPGLAIICKKLSDRLYEYTEQLVTSCSATAIGEMFQQCPKLMEYITQQNKLIKVVAADGNYITVQTIIDQNSQLLERQAEYIEKLLQNQTWDFPNLEKFSVVCFMQPEMQDRLFLDPRFIWQLFLKTENNGAFKRLASTASEAVIAKFMSTLQYNVIAAKSGADLDRTLKTMELVVTHRDSLTESQKQEFLFNTIFALIVNAINPMDLYTLRVEHIFGTGRGLIDSALKLLDLLKDKNLKYKDKLYLWHLACTSNSEPASQLRKYLLEHNVDPECVDEEGRTGIEVALTIDKKNKDSNISNSIIQCMDLLDIVPSYRSLKQVLLQIIQTTDNSRFISSYSAKLQALPKWQRRDLVSKPEISIWQESLYMAGIDEVCTNLACYIQSLGMAQEAFLDHVASFNQPGLARRLGIIIGDRRLQQTELFTSTVNVFAYLANRQDLCARINTESNDLYYALWRRWERESTNDGLKLKKSAVSNEYLYDSLNGTNSKDDPIGIAAKNQNFDFFILLLREFKSHLSNPTDIIEQIHEVLSAMIDEDISIEPMLEYLRKDTNSFFSYKAWSCCSLEARMLTQLQAEIAMHKVAQRGKLKLM